MVRKSGYRPRRGNAARRRGTLSQHEPDEQSTSASAEALVPHPPTTSAPLHDPTVENAISQDSQDDTIMVSPNDSPVSAPTETPASTPVRAPVQRLESLTGAGIGGRGRSTAGVSKFRPRAVRRGQEERERAERDELERRKERALASGTTVVESNRSRGTVRGKRGPGKAGARGRGDAMGRNGLDRNSFGLGLKGASGVFGMAPAGPSKRAASHPRPREAGAVGPANAPSNVTTSGPSNTQIKHEPGHSSHDPSVTIPAAVINVDTSEIVIKPEMPEPIYPEEQQVGARPIPRRVDIENINLVSDDEPEDDDEIRDIRKVRVQGRNKLNANKGGMRPVRLQRQEHKERVTMVNTEPAAAPPSTEPQILDKDDDDELFVPEDEASQQDRRRNVEFFRDGKRWQGAWSDELPQIKYDPEGPTVSTYVDSSRQYQEQRLPSETREHHEPTFAIIKPNQKGRSRRKSSNRERKPILQTEEDKAEYMRHVEDVHILAQELGGLQTAFGVERGLGDEDVEMDDQQSKRKNKEGRLYLFQFPPILPPLYNPVKKEEASSDIEMTGFGAAPITAAGADSAIDLTKLEAEESVGIKHDAGQSGVFQVVPDLIKEAGYMGKLVVRESGKVELNWGGTSLQLGRGAEFDFLTTTLIMDRTEDGDLRGEDSDSRKGQGTGMGRVMGKFVATPDWGQLLR